MLLVLELFKRFELTFRSSFLLFFSDFTAENHKVIYALDLCIALQWLETGPQNL